MATLAPDSTLDKYRIIRLLGRGGMADVYEAEDTRIGRRVALKLLPASFARDEEQVARFEKEIRSSAALEHPNIVPIFDVGEFREQTYYTMALLSGGDLKSRIVNGGLTPEVATKVICTLSLALEFAHKQGFVHRDVKPENIIFSADGRPYLTDFGISKAIGADTRMTAVGMSIGTPHYMSPEQAKGLDVDGRSDFYAIGAVFFECLTGATPYEAQDSFALGIKHINEPIPQLPSSLSHFQPVVDRLMAKNPDDRYGTAHELEEHLHSCLHDKREGTRISASYSFDSTPTREESVEVSSGDGSRIKPLVWLVIGSVSALLMVAAIYYYGDGIGGQRPIPADSGASSSNVTSGRSALEETSTEVSQNGDAVHVDASHARSSTQNANKEVGGCSLRTSIAEQFHENLAEEDVRGLLDEILDRGLSVSSFEGCSYPARGTPLLDELMALLEVEHEEILALQSTLSSALERARSDVKRLAALARLSEISGDDDARAQAESTLAKAEQSIDRIGRRIEVVNDYEDSIEKVFERLGR